MRTSPAAVLAAALAAALLLGGLALALGGCGVEPQDEPEPLPPTAPFVLPPSVTQEPAAPLPR